jgi:molybdopterin converting factor subunit 1
LKVRVRVFAALREILGKEEVEVELPEGTTVDGLWTQLVADDERLAPFTKSINFALNHDFVGKETELSPNDEVAFLPPVSGG